MTVTMDHNARRRGLAAGLLAWLWPRARPRRDRRAALAAWSTLLGWLWPSAIHDEPYGRRHGLLATLFGWAWPGAFDRGVRRWWHVSWLWSWTWPGHVLGPDGEICPLAPWHPALRPEVCPGEPWQHKLRRHGPVMFMMFSATAIAAPTFMEGNLPADGGRLNLFHADGPTTEGPPFGGEGPAVEPGDGPGGGLTTLGAGGLTGGGGGSDPTPGTGDTAPPQTGFDGGLGDGDPGLGGGDTPGGEPTGGGETTPSGDGGTTILDPDADPNGDLTPGPALGGGGGAGGGGGGGGGAGGGGGDPSPPGGDGNDPFTPPETNPPVFDPPGPMDPNQPAPPTPPGGGPDGGPVTVPQELAPPGGDGDEDEGGGGPAGDTGPRDGDRVVAGVPEPGAWAMMILGFGAVGYAIRRRRMVASIG